MNNSINKVIIANVLFYCIMFTASCKKESIKQLPMASLTTINVVVGGSYVLLGNYSSGASNNFYTHNYLFSGEHDLYLWPFGDSLHPYFMYPKFYVESNELYSLYLCGMPSAVEGIMVKESFPYNSDSTCGIRIVNLSPNSNALNITLNTSPSINEVSNLAYKQFTDFKLYSAKAATTNYTFQVRKASDNSIVVSYLLTIPRFANVTLVIRGLIGGAGNQAINITRVNNDR